MRQPQFLGEQIQYPVILLRMLARQRQMLGRRLQRMQMPLARQPRRLRARIPPAIFSSSARSASSPSPRLAEMPSSPGPAEKLWITDPPC